MQTQTDRTRKERGMGSEEGEETDKGLGFRV